ncbi:MAG TPA: DUF559 domain-containing protein [Solirubrobacter sp.]|nr:DUF559 domain-containing protein [Solirubrobacter sp.]
MSKLGTPPWALAAQQHGVVAARQLGMSTAAIASWVQAGRLHPLYRGVYAYGHAALSWHGRWMAAVLAAGDGAALTGGSAAALHRVVRRVPPTIDVLAPRPRASKPGLRIHTCRRLDPRDVTVVDRIPVATVARMLVDLTDTNDADEIANVIHEAAFRRIFDLAATEAALARANGRRHVKVLEEALRLHVRGSAGSRSRLEQRFRRLVQGAGLPLPRRNVIVNGFEVDFFWPGLCVEVDGEGHRRPRSKADDRIRDAALRAAGYVVLRFTEEDLLRRPGWVLAQLAPQKLAGRVAGQ